MALTKVTTGGITDATIATADIANDAVTADKLADNAVDTNAIQSSGVVEGKIASGAITSAKIGTDQVTNSKIAQNAVTAYSIADATISATQLANNAITTDKVTDDAVTQAKLNFPVANRNLIINGAMQVAQRATSFTNISSSGVIGSVDRMIMVGANLDQLGFAGKQTSDGPDGFTKCFEFDVTTAESALDANDLVYIRYKVEGQDLVPLFNANGTGKNFVLSFYVKAYQTGTYQLNIYKPTGTRYISKTYSIASSGVWQRVEVPITGDTNTSGINDDTGNGFAISWMLAAGTDYTSAGVLPNWGNWPGNSGFAGGQAVNVASSTDNYFRITGIQLELGDTATDFEHRSYQDEIKRCMRYFQKIFNTQIIFSKNTSSRFRLSAAFMEPMRGTPSYTRTSSSLDAQSVAATFSSSDTTEAQGGNTATADGISYSRQWDFGGFSNLQDRSYGGASGNHVFNLDAEI